MPDRKRQAHLALRIVEGIARDEPEVEELIMTTFDGPQAAAEAYAHLSGFLLQTLAKMKFNGSIPMAAIEVGYLIDRSGDDRG